jgi:hypothetical protein
LVHFSSVFFSYASPHIVETPTAIVLGFVILGLLFTDACFNRENTLKPMLILPFSLMSYKPPTFNIGEIDRDHGRQTLAFTA